MGKKIGLGLVFTVLGIAIVGAGAFLYLYMTLSVPKADQVALAQNTTVYYADGTTEMGSFSEVNRTIIDASTLPKYVGEAVVSSEDRTFYTNSGVDFKGIVRALVNNVTGGSRQGASTLTQQYVENYYLGSTHTYAGKVKEAAGKVVGNDRLQAEGLADQAEGKTQKNYGKVKDAVKDQTGN